MNVYQLLLTLIFGLLVIGFLISFLPMRRSRAQTGGADDGLVSGPAPSADDTRWYGFLYYNPDDPELLVPKRFGIGWTINFGHPLGKLFAVITIILLLLPVAMSIFAPGLNSAAGCHPSGCHLLP